MNQPRPAELCAGCVGAQLLFFTHHCSGILILDSTFYFVHVHLRVRVTFHRMSFNSFCHWSKLCKFLTNHLSIGEKSQGQISSNRYHTRHIWERQITKYKNDLDRLHDPTHMTREYNKPSSSCDVAQFSTSFFDFRKMETPLRFLMGAFSHNQVVFNKKPAVAKFRKNTVDNRCVHQVIQPPKDSLHTREPERLKQSRHCTSVFLPSYTSCVNTLY